MAPAQAYLRQFVHFACLRFSHLHEAPVAWSQEWLAYSQRFMLCSVVSFRSSSEIPLFRDREVYNYTPTTTPLLVLCAGLQSLIVAARAINRSKDSSLGELWSYHWVEFVRRQTTKAHGDNLKQRCRFANCILMFLVGGVCRRMQLHGPVKCKNVSN